MSQRYGIMPGLEDLRRWIEQEDTHHTWIMRLLDGPQVFYYPACDATVWIGRMGLAFNPAPWRADVFCWPNPPINRPCDKAAVARK